MWEGISATMNSKLLGIKEGSTSYAKERDLVSVLGGRGNAGRGGRGRGYGGRGGRGGRGNFRGLAMVETRSREEMSSVTGGNSQHGNNRGDQNAQRTQSGGNGRETDNGDTSSARQQQQGASNGNAFGAASYSSDRN